METIEVEWLGGPRDGEVFLVREDQEAVMPLLRLVPPEGDIRRYIVWES